MSEERFDRIETMLTQLISNVGSLRADADAFRKEMYEFRSEMYEFRSEMYEFRDDTNTFRNEVNQRFDRLEGQIANIGQRLDYQRARLAKAEEDIYVLQESKK